MNGIDAVEILKNDSKSNALDWLRETSLISYGVVTDVLGEGIVSVTALVRNGAAIKTMTVPLISTGGAMHEESSDPQDGDLVLLLFVNKTDPSMFDSAQNRFNVTGDWSIFNKDATGYSKFSAVGILLRPFKGIAATVARYSTDENGDPTYMFKTSATVRKIFRREFSLMFDSLPKGSGLIDRLVSVSFGKNSPFQIQHWAAVTREYGFVILPDNTLVAVTAPVKEYYSQYAPITRSLQGNVTEDGGLAFNPPGNFASGSFTELVTVVTKRYHGKLTLNLDMRGPVNMSFGIGNAETGNPTTDRNSPVVMTFGAQASLTITSKSFFSATFQGPITLKTGTGDLIWFGNSVGDVGATGDQFWAALQTFANTCSTATTAPQIAVAAATLLATLPALRTKWTGILK